MRSRSPGSFMLGRWYFIPMHSQQRRVTVPVRQVIVCVYTAECPGSGCNRYKCSNQCSRKCISALRRLVLVGAVGVEPTTNGLKGRCSATELRP
jgi:hypothetical protein